MSRRLPSTMRSFAIVATLAVVSTLFIGVQPAASQTVPMCFPVTDRPVHYSGSFGDSRGGGSRSHEGEDIMGAKMFELVAPVDGVVLGGTDGIRWSGTGHSGHSVRMRGDDGNYYAFLHMNDDTPGTDDGNATYDQVFGPGIAPGVRVNAGQLVGYMGDSGNAEGSSPHLHFEMRRPDPARPDSVWASIPFDPYDSLKAAPSCGLANPDIAAMIPGDFDGDGEGELFAYVPGPGADRLFVGSADRTLRGVTTVNVGGTYQPLTGDFDGDGRTDILWYAPGSAPESLWYGTATTGEFKSVSAPTANGDYAPLLGDFDGDGFGDIVWYAAGPDPDYVWYGSGRKGQFSSFPTTANGTYQPFTGDFDGDGRTDIMWYGPGFDRDYVWYGKGRRGEFLSQDRISNGVYKPFTGDFDGDGHDDVYWYAPGSHPDYLWYGSRSRGRYQSIRADVSGVYKPVSVDLDGDGNDDIFWWSPAASLTPTWFGHRTPGRFVELRLAP